MPNRRLHRILMGGITGIVLFAIAGAWFLVSHTSLFFAFVCFFMIVVLAILLIKKMEKLDVQLNKFFRAIHNNDFRIHFAEREKDRFLYGLFQEMNRIMAQFEENRTVLEERRFYYESIIRVLTHEIRNSITPIASLSADLIKYPEEYGEKGMIDGLQTIHQQARQLNTFLDAYHRLTHLPDPVKAKVEIPVLFDKLQRLLNSEPGSKYIHYISLENMEVLCDQNLITLALINLIRNALQATVNTPEPQIVVEAGREKSSSFLRVIDNGEGIIQSRLEDIFIPFYSTKKEGSGIGLPLSRRIMQLHGGELFAYSTPGEQTVFGMHFPD
ncbi:sensor histidine kinase [Parabacteroides sp. 52]|nr:signal transduction histidine kinase [Parabacteroides sp. PM5-20]NDV54642.1 sensor histidine kinase [Parabacteroides sp. 52]